MNGFEFTLTGRFAPFIQTRPPAGDGNMPAVTWTDAAVTGLANGQSQDVTHGADPGGTATPRRFVSVTQSVTGGVAPAFLANFNGANGATAFSDSSANNATITGFNAPALSTATKKFGTASIALAANKYLRIPRTATLTPVLSSVTEWSVECWVYQTSAFGSAVHSLFQTRTNNAQNAGVIVGVGSTGTLVAYASSDGSSWNKASNTAFGTAAVSLNQWVHVRFRKAPTGLWYGWVNGVQGTTPVNIGLSLSDSGAPLSLLGDDGGTFGFTGFADAYEIFTGVDPYAGLYDGSGNFTPPTTEPVGVPANRTVLGPVGAQIEVASATVTRLWNLTGAAFNGNVSVGV